MFRPNTSRNRPAGRKNFSSVSVAASVFASPATSPAAVAFCTKVAAASLPAASPATSPAAVPFCTKVAAASLPAASPATSPAAVAFCTKVAAASLPAASPATSPAAVAFCTKVAAASLPAASPATSPAAVPFCTKVAAASLPAASPATSPAAVAFCTKVAAASLPAASPATSPAAVAFCTKVAAASLPAASPATSPAAVPFCTKVAAASLPAASPATSPAAVAFCTKVAAASLPAASPATSPAAVPFCTKVAAASLPAASPAISAATSPAAGAFANNVSAATIRTTTPAAGAFATQVAAATIPAAFPALATAPANNNVPFDAPTPFLFVSPSSSFAGEASTISSSAVQPDEDMVLSLFRDMQERMSHLESCLLGKRANPPPTCLEPPPLRRKTSPTPNSDAILPASPQRDATIQFEDLQSLLHANPHLCESSIRNFGFLFEIPDDDFEDLDRDHSLTKLSFFAPERMKHITALHFVIQNHKQFYHAKTAAYPHGQVTLAEFVEGVAKLEPTMRPALHVYWPTVSWSNDFLVVENESDKVDHIDWEFVNSVVPNVGDEDIDGGGVTRQAQHVDFGHTGWRSCTRVGGVSMPATTTGTKNPRAQAIMGWMSTVMMDSNPSFRFSMPERDSVDVVRCSRTTPSSRCQLHRDNKSNSTRTPDVVGLSIVVGGQRLSINAQFKASMDQATDKVTESADLTSDLLNTFDELPSDRKSVCVELLCGTKVDVLGRAVVSNLCNIDPLSYGQPVLYSCARLQMKFNLNILELQSVHLASVFVNESKIYFSVAADMLMDLPVGSLKANDRGIFLGRLLAMMASNVQQQYHHSAGRHDLRRFPKRTPAPIPPRAAWRKLVLYHTAYCLHVFRAHEVEAVSRRSSVYEDALNRLQSNVLGAGELVTGHLLGEKACLGLLPAWFREHAKICGSSRAVDFFKHKYGMAKRFSGDGLRRFAKDIAGQLKDRFGYNATTRTIENLFCKFYRIANGNDGKWRDVLVDGQPLFTFPSLKVCEIHTAEGVVFLDGPFVLNSFPYGRGTATMPEIVRAMKLHRVVPDDAVLETFVFPPEFVEPSSELDVEFELGPMSRTGRSTDASRIILRRVGY